MLTQPGAPIECADARRRRRDDPPPNIARAGVRLLSLAPAATLRAMKPFALLGLVTLVLSACGDTGGDTSGNSTATGTTTGSTGSSSSSGTGSTADPPTTGSGSASGSTGETTGETTGVDPTSTTTTESAVTDTDSTGTTDATTTDDSTGDTSSGSSDSSTGAPIGEPLMISLKEVIVYGNCMPIIDPDSVVGFWTVSYDNTQGTEVASAELTKATLTLSPGDMPSVHDLTVIPTQSGPVAPGQSVAQEQMKQQGAPTPGCGFCNKPFRLDLTFTSGGVEVPVVHEDILGCVF